MENLEERLEPLNNILTELCKDRISSGDIIKFTIPENYMGVLDVFTRMFEKDKKASFYILWLDKKHEKFSYWKSFLRTKGKNFYFEPKQDFKVKGEVVKKGILNDFEYYFIKRDFSQTLISSSYDL